MVDGVGLCLAVRALVALGYSFVAELVALAEVESWCCLFSMDASDSDVIGWPNLHGLGQALL